MWNVKWVCEKIKECKKRIYRWSTTPLLIVPHGGPDPLADLDRGDQIRGGPSPRGHRLTQELIPLEHKPKLSQSTRTESFKITRHKRTGTWILQNLRNYLSGQIRGGCAFATAAHSAPLSCLHGRGLGGKSGFPVLFLDELHPRLCTTIGKVQDLCYI